MNANVRGQMAFGQPVEINVFRYFHRKEREVKQKMRLIPEHVTAARGLLRMSQDELGQAAGVSAQTIRFFENRHTTPREETIQRIREALERRGIVFSNGDRPGVMLDPSKAIIPPHD